MGWFSFLAGAVLGVAVTAFTGGAALVGAIVGGVAGGAAAVATSIGTDGSVPLEIDIGDLEADTTAKVIRRDLYSCGLLPPLSNVGSLVTSVATAGIHPPFDHHWVVAVVQTGGSLFRATRYVCFSKGSNALQVKAFATEQHAVDHGKKGSGSPNRLNQVWQEVNFLHVLNIAREDRDYNGVMRNCQHFATKLMNVCGTVGSTQPTARIQVWLEDPEHLFRLQVANVHIRIKETGEEGIVPWPPAAHSSLRLVKFFQMSEYVYALTIDCPAHIAANYDRTTFCMSRAPSVAPVRRSLT